MAKASASLVVAVTAAALITAMSVVGHAFAAPSSREGVDVLATGNAQVTAFSSQGADVPAAGYAQADDGGDASAQTMSEAPGATLDCRAVGLRIMAAEVSGAHFVCQVSGAPAGDSRFTVNATSATDQAHTVVPLCSGNLASGAGICIGAFIDRAASGLTQMSLAVTLQPSGTALGPVVVGPSPPAPAAFEPMQFDPLPDPY
jgi:hypothetical protein